MAAKAAKKGPEKYEPGTKGHELAFGDEENVMLFDLDEDGGVINLRPRDEAASKKGEDEE